MRLLLLYPRMPYPPDKGDKVRTYHQFGYLSQKHEVWCASFVDDPDDRQHIGDCMRLCAEFEAIPLPHFQAFWSGLNYFRRGRSLTEGYLHDRRMQAIVQDWSCRTDFDAVLCFGSGMGPYGLQARAKRRCLDLCDLDSAKWADFADRRKWPLSRIYAAEAARVENLERELETRFDAVTLVSNQEVSEFRRRTGSARVHLVSNGVDTEEQAACGPPSLDPILAFVGAMDYWPNEDAVLWFAAEVWPTVRRRVPKAEWVIVGRNPGRKIRRLARIPGISVTGRVPEVISYLRGARVVVAPLRSGRGVQNKVLEGMSCGRPVVVSPRAAEGISPCDIPGVRVASTASETISALLDWLCTPGRAETAGRDARRWVCENFLWADRLEELERVLAGPRPVPAVERPAIADQEEVAVGFGGTA